MITLMVFCHHQQLHLISSMHLFYPFHLPAIKDPAACSYPFSTVGRCFDGVDGLDCYIVIILLRMSSFV